MLVCQCFSVLIRKKTNEYKRNILTIMHKTKHLIEMLAHAPTKGHVFPVKHVQF